MSITLRPYQDKFEADIRAEYVAGANSVLAVLPTGGGKTVVFSDMAAKAQAKGNSVGIFAHRAEILDQIGRALGSFGVDHGYLAPGFQPNPLANVQVCSIQAASRRIDRFLRRPFDFVIFDEAHHAAAGSAYHAIINAHQGKRILGVTATPQRLSGEPLNIAFQKMVVGPTTAELIGLGALTPFKIFAPAPPDMTGVGRIGGDFKRIENEAIMDRPKVTGNAVDHYKRLTPGKRAIVFCTSVEHAEHVAAEFEDAGVKAASLDGKMDRAERRAVLGRFSSGIVPVLTSCEIVSEGFDVPAIDVAILLRPTESLALYLQQVGRALRPYPGKQFAYILDHAGNSLPKSMGGRGHGFPDDVREWRLEGVRKAVASGERTIPTVICGQCFYMFRPAPCCPNCGHTRDVKGREIEHVEGELAEIDPNLIRQARAEEQAALNRRVQQTRTLPALCKLAIELGRDEGWVFQLHKNRGNPGLDYGQVKRAMHKARVEVAA